MVGLAVGIGYNLEERLAEDIVEHPGVGIAAEEGIVAAEGGSQVVDSSGEEDIDQEEVADIDCSLVVLEGGIDLVEAVHRVAGVVVDTGYILAGLGEGGIDHPVVERVSRTAGLEEDIDHIAVGEELHRVLVDCRVVEVIVLEVEGKHLVQHIHLEAEVGMTS
jgi:hypothetical protein